MKVSRFTAEQIVAILHEAAAGAAVREVSRRHGITETTFYGWPRQYGRLRVSETKRLKVLEEENRRLKKLVADLSLDNAMRVQLPKASRPGPLTTLREVTGSREISSSRTLHDCPINYRTLPTGAVIRPSVPTVEACTIFAGLGSGAALSAGHHRRDQFRPVH